MGEEVFNYVGILLNQVQNGSTLLGGDRLRAGVGVQVGQWGWKES